MSGEHAEKRDTTAHGGGGMNADQVIDWLARRVDAIPPFCVEIVLSDGARYFLHSAYKNSAFEDCLVVRIYDLRGLNPEEIEQVKKNINEIQDRTVFNHPEKIHPKLDWANLRVYRKEILYCIEWHDRRWPIEEDHDPIGFNG
jgi:hypothetical protein